MQVFVFNRRKSENTFQHYDAMIPACQVDSLWSIISMIPHTHATLTSMTMRWLLLSRSLVELISLHQILSVHLLLKLMEKKKSLMHVYVFEVVSIKKVFKE